ncbi:hypothetical protein [Solirubrobacter pauli]|uniref:hypothetical protein n=1 Tax=Solirubrobacter pauli TaxID=166793 RepID=UPI000EAC2877|nr:hypothetical protein [Solirubrobacter pauli]
MLVFVLLQGVGGALLMTLVTWVLGRADDFEASLRKGAWFGALMTVWWVGVVVVTRFRGRRSRGSD